MVRSYTATNTERWAQAFDHIDMKSGKIQVPHTSEPYIPSPYLLDIRRCLQESEKEQEEIANLNRYLVEYCRCFPACGSRLHACLRLCVRTKRFHQSKWG